VTKYKAWSDRFESALNPTIAKFNGSILFDIELLPYDIQGSIAHSKMLAETGIGISTVLPKPKSSD
jgi:argininosuccinate lyase